MDTLDLILRLLPLGVLVLQGVLTWLLWSIRSSFVAKAECQNCREVIKGDLTGLAKDHAVADARRDALPTARDMTEVRAALEGVRGDLRALWEKVEGQGELLKRIERPVTLLMDYHLKRDPK